jgi:hypothetical protein
METLQNVSPKLIHNDNHDELRFRVIGRTKGGARKHYRKNEKQAQPGSDVHMISRLKFEFGSV